MMSSFFLHVSIIKFLALLILTKVNFPFLAGNIIECSHYNYYYNIIIMIIIIIISSQI